MGVATRGGGVGMVVAEKRPELGETHDAVVDSHGSKIEVKATLGDYETKADLSKVKTYLDFEGLNHFDKLLGIKSFTDKALLSEIAEKSQAKQIKNMSSRRIAELV